MKKLMALFLVGIIGMHLIPHMDHARGEVLTGGDCRAGICDKKPQAVKARRQERSVMFEAGAMEAEEVEFDCGEDP